MKKILLLCFCLFPAILPAGCSGAKKPQSHPAPEQKPRAAAPATGRHDGPVNATAPEEFASQPETAAGLESRPGAVSGVVSLPAYAGATGNLFLFIVDDSGTSKDYKILSHTVTTKATFRREAIDFLLENVPPGERTVLGVWDTSEPFCKETGPYCTASARDAIGMSAMVLVKPGETVSGVRLELH